MLRTSELLQALDRCEDVLELRSGAVRPPTSHRTRHRAGRAGTSRGSGRGSPRDARRTSSRLRAKCRSEARVVDSRHDGLAGAGGRDEQVAVVTLVACQHDLLEQRLLERTQLDLDRAKQRESSAREHLSPPRELVAVVSGRSRCSPSSSRRRRPSSRPRPDCGRPRRERSTRARAPAPSASGSTSRCTPSSSRSRDGRARPSRGAGSRTCRTRP